MFTENGGEPMNTLDNDHPHQPASNHDEQESIANDRFIHGLIQFTHKDTNSTRSDRIDTVMEQIRSSGIESRSVSWKMFMKLVPLATAAIITLVAVSVFILAPQPKAYAMVNAAIEATRSAPELRYEIQILDQQQNDELMSLGSIDMRGELLLIEIETPYGDQFVTGRDHDGDWSLRRDGSVERLNPSGAAPRWINLGDNTVLVGPLDELLLQLKPDYAIEEVAQNQTGSSETASPQIIATRRPGIQRPGPDLVQIWITADTSIVNQLELHWTKSIPSGMDHARPEPRRGPPGVENEGPGPPRPQNFPDGENRPPHGHPEMLLNPPQFGSGHHPPPPQRIVFLRVDPVHLTDSDFSPPTP